MVRFENPALALQEIMRRDFRAFLRKAFPAIRGGDPISWNWHLDAIAYELDRVTRGNNHRLVVTMPPRNLKSIAISVAYVAWMLGRDPRLNFVCVSYPPPISTFHRPSAARAPPLRFNARTPPRPPSGPKSPEGSHRTVTGSPVPIGST